MATADELLDSAKAIATTPSMQGDGFSRAVISRGYYAAYHAARGVQEKLVLPPPAKLAVGSHEKLYLSLLECAPGHTNEHLAVKSIGMMALRILKPYRKAADYDIAAQLPAQAKDETLAKAALILEKAASITPR